MMQQSVIYQEIEESGALKGEQALVLRLLTRRLGSVSAEEREKVQSLSLPQLESLGEALLDFTEAGDLAVWLNNEVNG